MNDYQEFESRNAALAEVKRMRGWDAKAIRLHLVDHEGNRRRPWIVACREIGSKGDWLYLRRDGYVR